MRSISVLGQKNDNMLFSIPGLNVFFLMALSDLIYLSENSFEWFEEYLPNSPYSPYHIYLTKDGSVRDN